MSRSAASPFPSTRAYWAVLGFCLVAFIVGVRWAVVDRYGTDVPEWDQWDAEALHTLLPWFRGEPILPQLFTPHNEHYVVLTKLESLALVLLSGVWDQRMQCVVNATLPALLALGLAQSARGVVSGAAATGLALFLAALWAAPLAWQNVVAGFHSQQFYLLGFAFVAIACLPFAYPFSARWWIGVAAAGLGLLTMASGFFASVVVLGLLLARVLRREITVRAAVPGVLVALAVVAVGWFTRHEVSYHAGLRATGARDFLSTVVRALQWPAPFTAWLGLLIWLPWIALAGWVMRQRPRGAAGDHALLVLGLGSWVGLQVLAAGYARGAGGPPPAVRYLDTLVFGASANALALALLAAQAPPGWWRRSVGLVTLCWLGAFSWGAARELRHTFTVDLPHLQQVHRNAIRHVRAYLESGDEAFLNHADIPYPAAGPLLERLRHPEIRRLLPVSIRPPTEAAALSRVPANPNWAAVFVRWGHVLAGLAGAGLLVIAGRLLRPARTVTP